ncbi:MAG TPA: hypothetical protein PKW50_03370, partial [Syntrophomonas sp.]|nr:hypothetical protein [Syntrophomonas sp.]
MAEEEQKKSPLSIFLYPVFHLALQCVNVFDFLKEIIFPVAERMAMPYQSRKQEPSPTCASWGRFLL